MSDSDLCWERRFGQQSGQNGQKRHSGHAKVSEYEALVLQLVPKQVI